MEQEQTKREPVTAVLIDDDELYRMTLGAVVTRMGVTIVGEAGDGRAGIDLILDLQPDLILLDILMPTLDGIAAMTELTVLLEDPYVVIVSSVPDEKTAPVLSYAKDYLLKTAPMSELADRLQEHVDLLAAGRDDPYTEF